MTTGPDTKIVAVLSHPRGETDERRLLSRLLADRAAEASVVAVGVPPRDVAEPVEAVRRLGGSGVLLVGRLREAGSALVDRLSDEAHGSGVTDTVRFDGEEAIGYNSEARAIVALLEEHADRIAGRTAVILGAGAVARAAAWALARHFRIRSVAVASRNVSAARLLKESILSPQTDTTMTAHELFPPDIADELSEARLIVNATPIGGNPEREETPITLPDLFSERQIVLDVVNSPQPTRLLADATAAGATTIDGAALLERRIAIASDILVPSTAAADVPDEEGGGK